MKVKIFSIDYSKIKEIFNHFPKDIVHAITYYTKGHYLKLTWEFDNESDRNKAISYLKKFKEGEVYPTDKDGKLFATIKFSEEFNKNKLTNIFGVEPSESYFAHQTVLRYYL